MDKCIFAFLITSIIVYVMQLVYLFVALGLDDIKTKKELINILIPYSFIYLGIMFIKNKWNDLE